MPSTSATERDPGRTALAFYGRSITYRELRDATDRLACALSRLGVKEGRPRRPLPRQQPQFVIAYSPR
jgi:fatty-acyl-CoA synthase